MGLLMELDLIVLLKKSSSQNVDFLMLLLLSWVHRVVICLVYTIMGWCHPHRFRSYAPPRGLEDDDSEAQGFVDGRAAFDAIALANEEAKSEIFMCGWWLCPDLYLRRPFHANASSSLDVLLEAKAKQGVQGGNRVMMFSYGSGLSAT